MKLDPIERVIAEIRAGRPIVMIDDKDRENEGDIMVAAELVTEDHLAFMIREGKGLICISITEDRRRALGLPMQVAENSSPFGTNFAVSFDHREVRSSAVSAAARAFSIRAAAGEHVSAADYITPGYVFPVVAQPGGVLKRRGQTEGSVDIARLAGLRPAGVICEIMAEDGTMLRGLGLQEYCERHGLLLTSVEAICQYRLEHESSIRRVASCDLGEAEAFAHYTVGRSPVIRDLFRSAGKAQVMVFVDDVDGEEHLALVVGTPQDGCLVRVHSECLTGDVFSSQRCDCGAQLDEALRAILTAGQGVVIYLHQEGRGIGLGNKLRAYELQDTGVDTVDANVQLGFAVDARNYRAAADILADLHLASIRLMTNNPEKVNSLCSFGINVTERVPVEVSIDEHNRRYMEAKRDRLGHLLQNPATE